MNSATHALIGMLLAALLFPGNMVYLLAGLLGGFMPDLDSLTGTHRKTLHFPWIYTASGILLLLAGFFFTPATIAAVFFLSAGLHSLLDILAGGELRSWKGDEWGNHAVYDHVRKQWFRPRRTLYDPSPRGFLVLLVVSAGLLFVENSFWMQILVSSVLASSLGYLLAVRYLDVIPDRHRTLNEYLWTRIRRKERDWP